MLNAPSRERAISLCMSPGGREGKARSASWFRREKKICNFISWHKICKHERWDELFPHQQAACKLRCREYFYLHSAADAARCAIFGRHKILLKNKIRSICAGGNRFASFRIKKRSERSANRRQMVVSEVYDFASFIIGAVSVLSGPEELKKTRKIPRNEDDASLRVILFSFFLEEGKLFCWAVELLHFAFRFSLPRKVFRSIAVDDFLIFHDKEFYLLSE